ncbi:hypothetical protein JIG36_50460 [Actinoplanes sp. LDG1-06]|uniref:A-factor biosynthesis hotdog domain-containing protein n=1 Tax=Paractinoplanes ovalisporus TaxID=2810368 RepID=A0ABS2AV55_9ACTN|nr:AfsA-related hotdog domain-containing protein [Actinoplanes ovalisporus]MBM2623742.1 hypothetical protein [Actinoplanes ovalisporus]
MEQQLTDAERIASAASSHLIHRPRAAGNDPHDPARPAGERFALAGLMPHNHPLLSDGPARVHDPQLFVQLTRQVGTFIGRRWFRVPRNRSARLDRLEFTLTAPDAWRTGDGPATMAMDLDVAPTATSNGTAEHLRLRATMEIDGVACGTGLAGLAFLGAPPHRAGRRSRAGTHDSGRRPGRAAPSAVGRHDPRNVVVSTPEGTGGTLTTELVADPGNLVFFPERTGLVPDLLLVEAIRQTSLLTANRDCGFRALHTWITRASVRLPGTARLDLPSTCTARVVPGDDDPGRDAVVRVSTTIHQLDDVVAEAEVSLSAVV